MFIIFILFPPPVVSPSVVSFSPVVTHFSALENENPHFFQLFYFLQLLLIFKARKMKQLALGTVLKLDNNKNNNFTLVY